VTLLADWMEARAQFVCVVPRDYQRVRIAEALARAENREPVFAELVGAARG
jgi:glutamate synthase domain-containing protein 3